MGGAGAYLALGTLGMPLALAVTLQLLAPRGSREALWTRLGESGQGSLVVLLCRPAPGQRRAGRLDGRSAGELPFAIGLRWSDCRLPGRPDCAGRPSD